MLTLVKKLLDIAKKENEDIHIQKIDLEKVQFELQTLTQTLEGGMLNRKKSLQGVERNFEPLVKKNQGIMKGIGYL